MDAERLQLVLSHRGESKIATRYQRELGPVGVRPTAIGRGRGRSVLIAALHRMRDEGRDQAEIGWVGPIRPYAETVGAVINRLFFVYRKERRPQ